MGSTLTILLIIGIAILVIYIVFRIFGLIFHWILHLLPVIGIILIIIWLLKVVFHVF